jgi:thioredoxin 1
MPTKNVTDGSFQADVLDSETPVLVDFWADWCGPCKMIAPALEEISDELSGRVTIAKMDIMENPEVPGKIGVQSIPLMVLFKNGTQEPAQGLAGERSLVRQSRHPRCHRFP